LPKGRVNYYGTLRLSPSATMEQVDRAYREALDALNGGGGAEPNGAQVPERTQLRAAHDVLSDPVRRLEYDLRNGLITAAPSAPAPSRTPPPLPSAVPVTAEASPQASAELPVLDQPVTGAALRACREAQGVSLEEIAEATKVGLRYLRYIEEERHAFLPPAVYLKSFLQEYARAIGLDPKRTAEGYMARLPKATV
jgi:curved DNA-binding protein CbpA